MVNPGDYLPSDEEIDIEMLDSDVELSRSLKPGRKLPVNYAITDSDSDFETSKPKRGSAGGKRGGRGRGRGRGGATKTSRKTASADPDTPADPDAQPVKPRRGRPPKKKVDEANGEAAPEKKPASTRGRKKTTAAKTVSEDGDFDDDDDGEYGQTKKKRATKAKGKARQMTLDEIETPRKLDYDPEEVRSLANQYPDQYWKQLLQASAPGEGDGAVSGCIDYIDEEHPLELLPHSISDQMALTGMALSLDGAMLATFGSSGQVHIWDTDTFECLTTLRDSSEPNIDEFFVGQFTPNSEYLVVGGKLKDRKRWSEADEDNHILPCPLKIFNVLTGEVVARLEGHSEEILCIKGVVFKGENYLVTTSQDGYIRRWHMDSDWVVLLDTKEITDGVTCMAFTVSFLPNTGNRYFMAATDDHVTLMDLEQGVIVQRFDPIYSSYCDCGKFIELVEEPIYEARKLASIDGDGDGDGDDNIGASGSSTRAPAADTSDTIAAPTGPHAYFVTRGVELLDAEDNTVSSRPNTCTLHRLVYPTEPNGKFALQEIRRYYHDEYLSNSWLIRIAANGRYLLAPTLNGQVFVFNIATGQVTGILRDHDTIEVRDCKFHPTKNLLFTCSDDGTVKVYRSTLKPSSSSSRSDTATIEAKETEAVSQQLAEPESPSTAAVTPLASVKESVEPMVAEPAAVVTTGTATTNGDGGSAGDKHDNEAAG